MKKMYRVYRVVMLCLCLLICNLSVPLTVFAQESDTQTVEPMMVSIFSCYTKLYISTDGSATITGTVKGKADVTYTYVKVTLQKSESGNWIDVKSWEDSNNGRSTTVSETYQVSRGTYRVVMTCSANSETKIVISEERTY